MVALRRLALLSLIAYWAFIFTLTHLPPGNLPHVPVTDKAQHFLAYGLLAGLLYVTIWLGNPRRRYLGVTVWGIGLFYGFVDEQLQAAVGRAAELADWLADAAAVTTAVLVLSSVRWWWERREAARPNVIVTPP
ncbi:MAG TPA: VanZ family protein [Tepidisphaeraceae bacterium]|nr:VanZ family protein [Tepidisphaeraceae bacterium]